MIQIFLGLALLCAIPFLSSTAGKIAAIPFVILLIWGGISETSKKKD